MSYVNGFFQILAKKDGVYIRVFPPKRGGAPISFDEISNYFDEHSFVGLDLDKINEFVENIDEIDEMKISDQAMESFDEEVKLKISVDDMRVYARFYPPSIGGTLLTVDDIMQQLKKLEIKRGISRTRIRDILLNRAYCTDFIIAQAKPPKDGIDDEVRYYFDTDRKPRPKLNEDGTVDFHHLDAINFIEEGSCLAELIKGKDGEEGYDLFNHTIPCKKSRKRILKFGKNIEISEDRTKLFSKVTGHVKLQEEQVFVSDTYEILSDVDSSTGDIEYDGNVSVHGTVRSGFSIKATGDINVDGVVEGAQLEAGGKVVIKRGMQGMNKGTINAKGNVYVKFIENSTVNTDGGVITEAIMHSEVTALGDILVDGKKGLITGGHVCSQTLISLRTGGSDMGTVTKLEVGADPKILEESRNIMKEIADLKNTIDSNSKIVEMYKKRIQKGDKLSDEKLNNLKESSAALAEATDAFTEKQERMMQLQDELEANKNGMVKVFDKIYPGVQINISDIYLYVKKEMKYCKLIRDGADIRSISL